MVHLLLGLWLLISGAPSEVVPLNGASSAGSGQVTTLTFRSAMVPGERRVVVWRPAGSGSAALPVVILLHGLFGQPEDWFDPKLGDLDATLTALMRSEPGRPALPPFIAIAPQGDNGYWTDHLGDSRARFGGLVEEALAAVAQRVPLARDRAILIGASMGGHGAVSRAFMRPERYRAVAALAGALFLVPPTHRPIYKQVWGFPADAAHWGATAPAALVQKVNVDNVPVVWLGIGKNDPFYKDNMAFNKALEERGIEHRLEVVDGAHTWTTWRALYPALWAWVGEILGGGRP